MHHRTIARFGVFTFYGHAYQQLGTPSSATDPHLPPVLLDQC
jgi:hypothetical protein